MSNTSKSMILFRKSLLQNLILDKHEIHVVPPQDEYSKELNSLGCKHTNIKLDRKSTNLLKELKTIYNLYKIFKQMKSDIVFVYTIKPIIYGQIVAKFSKIYIVAISTVLGYTFINNNLILKNSQSFI
ncbi:MAG: glycosyltransferase [Campylobacteraceae bacterium]